MLGWRISLLFGVLTVGLTACGEAEKAKTKAQEAVLEEAILNTLDDDSTFTAKIAQSPLKINKYEGKVSVVKFSLPRQDDLGESRNIDIKSGYSSLNLAPNAINFMQGVAIQVMRWHGEEEIPIVNPKEVPTDGSAYAIVAYSEIKRDNMNQSGNHDWYTYRTTEGVVRLTTVDPSAKGGVRGTVEFRVLLVEPAKAPQSIDDLPLVHFDGVFNVRPSGASEMINGQ